MNFKREKIKELYLKDTQVENFFIAEYMVDAEGDFVKVYLTALMYADSGEMSNSLIARHLGLNEEDVLRAWSYWETKGVIRKIYTNPTDRFHYAVEFLNLKERLYGANQSSEELKKETLPCEMDDAVLRDLIRSIETITGRLVEGKEPEALVSWICEDGVEPELIIFAYHFCAEKRRKTSFSYVSAVLAEWKKEGVRTAAQAERLLDETELRRSQYRRVMQALGFYRNPTEAEQSMIDGWLDKMEFSMDKVLEACGRTTGIGNPNFNYLNSILTKWYAEATGGSVQLPAAENSAAAKKNAVTRVNRQYEEIRRKNKNLHEERKKEVYQSVPRIRDIGEELRITAMEMAKTALTGGRAGNISADVLKKKIQELEAEKSTLLTENGFSPDYLELQYECTKCKDTGILDSGERCSCFSEKLKKFVL